MKNFFYFLAAALLVSCRSFSPEIPAASYEPSRHELARILSELPLGSEQLGEVYDAVSSSCGHGYDEEYLMSDLICSPGSGVGDVPGKSARRTYGTPIRQLMEDYLRQNMTPTKSGAADVEAYINSLAESDLQIYWPYSEDWDGVSSPVITFDPGYGAESSIGYEVVMGEDGMRVVDSLWVTEEVAMRRPVWVINSNQDSAYTPFDMFDGVKSSSSSGKVLKLSSFTMHRNYDSWFAGASEFFVKIGAVDGFKANKEEDLQQYTPSVTDMMIVVRRRDKGKEINIDSILLTNLTEQMEKVAFLIVEDDGGTTTSWKCSAVVKYNSKSYGFDIEIPYKDKDDIVWRGQLDTGWILREGGQGAGGRFGDVSINFSIE